MKTAVTIRTFIAVLACLATAATAFAQDAAQVPAEASAAQIIAAADHVRNPGQPFRLTNTIVEYVNGKARDSVTLAVFAKEDATTHQYRNLVQYIAPPRDAGKVVLLDGSKMWFYDPDSKASVRISQQQRLLGQASNGDAVTVNLARDYSATLVGEETVEDAEHQSRTCWHLDLKAVTPDAIYNRVEIWIEPKSFYSVKAKYYSDSGRLLKVVYFKKYQDQLGGKRPTEMIILDGVNESLVTTMSYSGYRDADIQDSWFQRDFLPKFKAK